MRDAMPNTTASDAIETTPEGPLSPHVAAELDYAKRIWTVAPIHGEIRLLKSLHRELEERFETGDRLVYLGNFIGRGKAIKAVFNELLAVRRRLLARPGFEAHDFVYVRGAQEEMWAKLLRLQLAPDPLNVLDWMLGHGVEHTIEAYGSSGDAGRAHCREGVMAITRWTGKLRRAMQAHAGHFELMTNLRRFACTAEKTLLFVHASIDPTRPLAMQGDMFWWDNGSFAKVDRPYKGYNRVIRGYDHKAHEPDFSNPYTATIDGGCGFGSTLNAVCFTPDGAPIDSISIAEE